jgi:hypothetical protein
MLFLCWILKICTTFVSSLDLTSGYEYQLLFFTQEV